MAEIKPRRHESLEAEIHPSGRVNRPTIALPATHSSKASLNEYLAPDTGSKRKESKRNQGSLQRLSLNKNNGISQQRLSSQNIQLIRGSQESMNADIGFLMTRNKINEKSNQKHSKFYDSMEKKRSNKPLAKLNQRRHSHHTTERLDEEGKEKEIF